MDATTVILILTGTGIPMIVAIGIFIANKLWSLKEDISEIKISLKEIENNLNNHVTETDKKISRVLELIEKQK